MKTNPLAGRSGQGLVEYALIIFLVAVAIAAALGLFGQSLSGVYNTISGTFPL